MRIPFVLLLSIFYCGISFSQTKSLLYSVKSKETNKTSYLFGTIHLIADSSFYFPTKLEKILLKTDLLVLEIGDLENSEKATQMMQLESGSCFDIFKKEQIDSIVNWGSTNLRMTPEAFIKGFSNRKPFALIHIGATSSIKGLVRSYELEFISRANSNKMEIGGLETMEFQLSLFDQLPDSIVQEMVMDQIRHPEEQTRMMRELTLLYEQQDLEALTEVITSSEEIGNSNEILLFERNRNWIPIMAQLMKEKPCFFAVGAGHLGGEKGVIALLKASGYTVSPITF